MAEFFDAGESPGRGVGLPSAGRRAGCPAGVDVRAALSPQDAARFLRENETVLIYNPATGTLNIGKTDTTENVIGKAS